MISVAFLVATALNADWALDASARPDDVFRGPVWTVSASSEEQKFQAWLVQFRKRAIAAGIKNQVLDQALTGLRYNPKIIKLDRRQSDFTKTIEQYLHRAVAADRIANGKRSLARYATTLKAIEKRYGVDKETIVAIWGIETNFGGFRGNSSTLRSLATLAYDARRSAFFEAELIEALKIVQSGDAGGANLIGSWAGAMGHTQFMPSSYTAHAVDFNGDGRRDIWSNDPTDALASTAAYLKDAGWKTGQPWAIEVRLPTDFNYKLANPDITKRPNAWRKLGIQTATGQKIKTRDKASLFLPAGADGPALMIFGNFEAIKRYNLTPTYIMAVGLTSDRLKGRAPLAQSWPKDARLLSLKERKELQSLLKRAGFDPRRGDGKLDGTVIRAVQDYQLSVALRPDGYASPAILNLLRKAN